MDIRDKLLDAAARVYAEVGYRGATTRRIAQEAGVNEITLFRHFGSKEALLVEAIRHCDGGFALPQLPREPVEPEAELTEWCLAHHAMLFEKRNLIRTCMGEMAERPELGRPGAGGPHIAAAMLRDYFVRLRERGMATAEFDPGCAAWLLLAAIFADAMWRDVMTGEEIAQSGCGWKGPEATFSECVRTVLRGVGALGNGAATAAAAAKPGEAQARSA